MKNNIFIELDKLTEKDFRYFQNNENISAVPYVLMLWTRGAIKDNEVHNFLLNEYVNPYVFKFHNHNELLYKLLCVANGGYNYTRYRFYKNKSSGPSEKYVKAIAEEYDCSLREAKDYYYLLSEEELNEII